MDEDDKELMYMMASHQHATLQNIEVERILNEFEDLNDKSDIVMELKKISSILNTNAFELSILNSNDSIVSLRVSHYQILLKCTNLSDSSSNIGSFSSSCSNESWMYSQLSLHI